jgi:hypothetical protein
MTGLRVRDRANTPGEQFRHRLSFSPTYLPRWAILCQRGFSSPPVCTPQQRNPPRLRGTVVRPRLSGRTTAQSRKVPGNAHRRKGKHLRVTDGYHAGAPSAMILPPGVFRRIEYLTSRPADLNSGVFFTAGRAVELSFRY